MDKKRAKEIIASPDMVEVTYNGKSIYIENVNDGNGIAKIYPINQPEKTEEVLVDNLIEH